MTKRKARIRGHVVYRFVVISWALLIPFFLYNQAQQARQTSLVKEIKQRPTSDWFEYVAITPTKPWFSLGESIYFKSTRIIQEQPPHITTDDMRFTFSEFLMCDYNDWEGKRRVDPESITRSVRIKPWIYTTAPRKWTWGSPYYLPATCCLQSKICITVEWIDKCQYIESSDFTVN